MADLKKLEALSVEELRHELVARAEKTLPASRASTLAQPTSSALEEFDTATVVEVLRNKQKVIYGVDDRQDHYNVTDQGRLQDGDSFVALFRSNAVVDNGNGTSTLATQNFRTAYELCNEAPAQVVIDNEIYQGVALLGREEISTGPDWASIRIDRAVTNHRIAPFRRTGRVTDNHHRRLESDTIGRPADPRSARL